MPQDLYSYAWCVMFIQVNSKEMLLLSKNDNKANKPSNKGISNTKRIGEKKMSLQEQMLADARQAANLDGSVAKSVDFRNIVKQSDDIVDREDPRAEAMGHVHTMIQEL